MSVRGHVRECWKGSYWLCSQGILQMISSCRVIFQCRRRTLLEEFLDLVRVELLHRYVSVGLSLNWRSRGACSFPLLGSPDIPRGRWHSLLPSCTVLGGGVRARVGVAVGLGLPPPAASIVSIRKLPQRRVRIVSDIPIFTRATHFQYGATVGGEEGSSRRYKMVETPQSLMQRANCVCAATPKPWATYDIL
jgi:hypothetical protein